MIVIFFLDPSTKKIYKHLKQGQHYELLPHGAWTEFVNWYEISDDYEEIKRYLLERGNSTNQ